MIASVGESRPTITELAKRVGVSASTVSRVVAQLAEQGLVERVRDWRHVGVCLADRVALAELLANRTAWPASEVIWATRGAGTSGTSLAAAGPAMYASFLGADSGEGERRHAHGSLRAFGREFRRKEIPFDN